MINSITINDLKIVVLSFGFTLAIEFWVLGCDTQSAPKEDGSSCP